MGKLDVVAVGYPSIDRIYVVSHLPEPDTTALIAADEDIEASYYGGCAPNVAVSCARLGIKAGLITVLGDDQAGRDYLAYLEEQGVETSGITVIEGEATSHSFLFRDEEGKTLCFFFPGAARSPGDPDKEKALVERADYLIITVGHPAVNERAIAWARERGVKIVWGMKADIYSYPASLVKELIPLSTALVMNEAEAKYVLSLLKFSSSEELLHFGLKVVVITRGREGSQVISTEGSFQVPAVPPSKVVDTTGAGDAFLAGFIYGLVRGEDYQRCALMGAINASFVLEGKGCQTNLPTKEQVLERLHQIERSRG